MSNIDRAVRVRALLATGLVLAGTARAAAAQSESALRTAFEGKTVTARIDMPGTSQGIDVNPLDPAPVDFREVAQRLKAHGTAIRIGQQVMVTKVVVREWYIEFQLGGGGYGTFGDMLNESSDVNVVQAGETGEERRLRDLIKTTSDKNERRRLERELNSLRSERERDNARARAEAQQANIAKEAMVRARRAESGSRFNVRYKGGFVADALTPESMMRALAAYVDFSGASAASGETSASLRKGQSVEQVEALLGPAATVEESKEGTLTIVKRSYRREGRHVVASFVSGVLVDFTITPR